MFGEHLSVKVHLWAVGDNERRIGTGTTTPGCGPTHRHTSGDMTRPPCRLCAHTGSQVRNMTLIFPAPHLVDEPVPVGVTGADPQVALQRQVQLEQPLAGERGPAAGSRPHVILAWVMSGAYVNVCECVWSELSLPAPLPTHDFRQMRLGLRRL